MEAAATALTIIFGCFNKSELDRETFDRKSSK